MSDLTNKQQAFLEAYLACGFNASEAARRAGYAKPGQQGHRLLKNVEIDAAIRQALADRAMPADEVLALLSEHARGSIGAFVATDDNGVPNGFSLKDDRPLHLVKKVSLNDKGWSFEMYDAQAALGLLGKYHGLMVERHEHSWKDELKQQGHDPDAIKQQLINAAMEALSSANRRNDAGSDSGGSAGDSVS